MSHVLVIPVNPKPGVSGQARLLWDNLSIYADVTASHQTSQVDYVRDGMTTFKWRPQVDVSTITVTQLNDKIDSIALAGVNWQQTKCQLQVKDDGVLIAEASGLRDNQPLFIVLEPRQVGSLTFTFSCINTSLEVGELCVGQSIKLPQPVEPGYQPARWQSDKQVISSLTQSNQFAGATVRQTSRKESFSINNVPIAFMEKEWLNFVQAAAGYPVFFLWSKDQQNQAVYGTWQAQDSRYDSHQFSTIGLTIEGVA